MSLCFEGLLIPTKNSDSGEYQNLVQNEPSATGDMAGRTVKKATLKDDLNCIQNCCTTLCQKYIGCPAGVVSCLMAIPAGVMCCGQGAVNSLSDITCIALFALPPAAYRGCSNAVRCYSFFEGCKEGVQSHIETARDINRYSIRAISNFVFGVIGCPFHVVGLSAANLATWSYGDLDDRERQNGKEVCRYDCSDLHATSAMGLFYLRRELNPHVSCELYNPEALSRIYKINIDAAIDEVLFGKFKPAPTAVDEMER